jgi:hypothetical protein
MSTPWMQMGAKGYNAYEKNASNVWVLRDQLRLLTSPPRYAEY